MKSLHFHSSPDNKSFTLLIIFQRFKPKPYTTNQRRENLYTKMNYHLDGVDLVLPMLSLHGVYQLNNNRKQGTYIPAQSSASIKTWNRVVPWSTVVSCSSLHCIGTSKWFGLVFNLSTYIWRCFKLNCRSFWWFQFHASRNLFDVKSSSVKFLVSCSVTIPWNKCNFLKPTKLSVSAVKMIWLRTS